MISHFCPALNPRFARLLLRGIVVILIMLLAAPAVYRSAHDAARAEENPSDPVSSYKADFASFPLSFIANAGQVVPDVRFEVRGMGGNLYFAPRDVTLIFPGAAAGTFATVRLHHLGANPTPVLSGVDLQPGVVNYILGNDSSRWLTDIPTYAGVYYEELYPGITLHYDGTTGLLKGTYLIAPGANPAVIRWQYDGVQRAQLDAATQDLRLYLSGEDGAPYLTEYAPHAWQEIDTQRVPVDVGYTLFDDLSIGLTLGEYDPSQPLFLDPLLQYSTYFGGASIDEGYGIAADAMGNVYVTGRTSSINLPRQNPLQLENAGGDDLFVSKINISSQEMIYSSFLGGSSNDQGNDIAVDAAGNAYITGETNSDDFPMPVPGVYQNTYQTGTDAFVVKLNATGSAILYSTYLGGASADRAYALAINGAGNVYITGETAQSLTDPFPIVNALSGMSTYKGGAADAFVTKFTADGTGLAFSTFLGGAAVDVGGDIAVDASNNVYIAGRTESTNFPLISPSQGTYGGGGDAFVTKITGGASPSFIYSTFMGGNDFDAAVSLAVSLIEGSAGKVYVTGETKSDNIPLLGALPLEWGSYNGGKDAFIVGYGSTGTRIFFTYLGGTNNDKGAGIGLDTDGDIYVVGETLSGADADPLNNFPFINGFQAAYGGLSDVFITKIVMDAPPTIEFSSFLGGGSIDQGFALAVVGGGTIYMTGDTWSDDFPHTDDTFQRGGGTDAFIIRIGASEADLGITKFEDISPVAVGQNLTYTITVTNHGPDATIATVTDDLKKATGPQYFAYVSATAEQGSCNYDAGTLKVTCALGELAAAQQVVVNLVVNVPLLPDTGIARNVVSVTGTEFDPTTKPGDGTQQNQYTQLTPVIYRADLEVTKLSSRYRVRQDETAIFSISIRNLGPGTATGVSLKDMLPADLIFESATPPAGTTYNQTTGEWTEGSTGFTIAPNTTRTLVIAAKVKVTVPVGAVITNSANDLVSGVPDPVTTNNSSTIELRVVTDVPETGCHPSPTNPNEIICLFG